MSKKVVVLSGSGISAESGLSTFRDNGGLWEQHDVMEVASHEGWRRNASLVLDFYNARRAQLENVKPNQAHLDLAAFENSCEVVVVTQNVDNLHERAGSSKVIHLHGELTKVRPEDSCTDFDGFDESRIRDVGYSPVRMGDVDERGVQYRPHIVFFGEDVPKMYDAVAELKNADALIIVGTSLKVEPAASLWRFSPAGCPVYIVDPGDAPLAGKAGVFHIRENASTGVAKALQEIKDAVW